MNASTGDQLWSYVPWSSSLVNLVRDITPADKIILLESGGFHDSAQSAAMTLGQVVIEKLGMPGKTT